MKKIIIVGGGFGGMNCAKALAKCLPPKETAVTVMDRRNHHLFQPLLYQVATAGLSPAEIAVPIRSEFARFSQVSVVLSEVNQIDRTAKVVRTAEGEEFVYDFLVVAAGATHSYFGHSDWEKDAPGLKTIAGALEIRRRVLTAYERAETATDQEERRALMTFVIVGGGPTGVELAGAIAEISRYTLSQDFRHIDPSRTRVLLIEAGPRVLGAFAPELSRRAARDLEELGVQVWTSTRVSDVSPDGVKFGSEVVRARTVIWAAGVRPSPLGQALGAELDESGRVRVSPELHLPGDPSVFVIGDLAHVEGADGRPLPGLAPVAMQEGKYVARAIKFAIQGKSLRPFRYMDKGMMATIGRSRAVVQLGRLRMTGFLAWCTWLFVHIFYLIGFQNKIFVFLRWAKGYLTLKRGARLI